MGRKLIRKSERDRTKLVDVIPLNTPFAVNLEPTSICNFKCRFCCHSIEDEQGIRLGNMDYDLFKKIIDDMRGFPSKIKTLFLYERGEPLLHPRISEMVHYAKDAQISDEISIFTNGTLLTHDMSNRLIDAGLDVLNVSIEGMSAEDYYSLTGAKVDFDKLIDNITYFYQNKRDCELYIKIIRDLYSKEKLREFDRTFSKICDYFFEEHLDDAWLGEQNLTEKEQASLEKRYEDLKPYWRTSCSCIFYKLVVRFDGSISACMPAFRDEMILGNARNVNVCDIWQGSEFNALRYAHLTKNKNGYPLCQICYGPKDVHHPKDDPDNLDNVPAEIIEKFNPANSGKLA